MTKRTIKTTTKEQYQKYENICHKLGLEINLRENTFLGSRVSDIQKLFDKDENLNNIPLEFFDQYFPMNRKITKSLAGNTYAIKHYMIYHVLLASPKFN